MAAPEDVLRPRSLTVNERVLLHLKESGTLREAESYPVTQPGIAQALGIRVNHVSRAVKALLRERLINERMARARGEVRRRKAYEVTEEGHALGQKLVARIASMYVVVTDESGERTMGASHARARVHPSTFTRLITLLDDSGQVNLREGQSEEEGPSATFEEGRPASIPLLGRQGEVASFLDWIEHGPPVLSLIGERGIGKSALVASALPRTSSQFWWSFRHGDRPPAFLRGLATWLAALEQTELKTRLVKETPDWREVARIVTRDLRGFDAILVLDDVQEAHDDLVPYIEAVIESVAVAGCKAVVTSEVALANRKILMAEGAIREVTIGGLSREAAKDLLVNVLPAGEFDKVYRLTRGNPLSLKLLASEETGGTYTSEERALLKVLRMREEQE